MIDAEECTRRFNGEKQGNLMILLFKANNSHKATSEAEISDFYKSIMLNRELAGVVN